MGGGIVAVDAAAEDGDRRSGGLERAAMSLGVDAAGETADDDEARGGEVAAEAAGDLPAVGRAGTRADDRDGGSGEQLDVCRTAEKETRRRIVDRPEQRREAGVGASQEAKPERVEPRQLGAGVEALP